MPALASQLLWSMETALALGSHLAPYPRWSLAGSLACPTSLVRELQLATGDARQRAKGWNGLTWSWRPHGRGQRCNWGRPGIGEEGADFVWGKGWQSMAQETHTLSRAVTRLTRLISSSFFSCRALSKPNAFPPTGDKESAGKRGYLPGHAPPPSSRACRAARTGGDSGTSGTGQRGDSRRLPWNLLLSATDMVCARLRTRRGTRGRRRRLVQTFGSVW